jgi:2'-5' RNA ligase
MNMYYIAIVLPRDLDEQIIKYKQYMLEKHDAKVGLKSPAHITIIPPFWLHPDLEEGLRSDLDALAGQLQPFPLSTRDFSAFKPRTIFIDVVQSEPLQEVKKAADQFFAARPQYPIKLEDRPFHPHITIATRDLHKAAFAEAWTHFKEKEFRKDWIVEGISLLRHNKKNWDVIQTSPFTNG